MGYILAGADSFSNSRIKWWVWKADYRIPQCKRTIDSTYWINKFVFLWLWWEI